MLADAEMEVLPAGTIGLKISRTLESQSGLVRGAKIRRATHKPRDVLCEYVQHFSRCVPPRDALCVSRKNGKIAVPPSWESTTLHQVDLARQFRIRFPIRIKKPCPFLPRLRAARTHFGRKVLIDAFGHQELCVFR